MTTLSEATIRSALQEVILPYLDQDPVTAGLIKNLQIIDNTVSVQIQLGFPLPADRLAALNTSIAEQLLTRVNGVDNVVVNCQWQIMPRIVQPGVNSLPAIKNIIAIGSAKGGVGKSTTAINLALAIAADGARVGLLDADIYGPNQPLMLGIHERPNVVEDKKLKPLLRYGMQTMSIGYLVGDKTPMIWRGPMVSSALQQLVNDTLWDKLDFLIIDLPPGTGDIQLTMSQKIPLAGAVIVTTPQDVALLDARKGIEMFRKVNLSVLGVVENMSHYICPHCGKQSAIFGDGGGKHLAQDCAVPLLGQLPLAIEIRQAADQGTPVVISAPDSNFAQQYRETARRMLAQLSLKKINYASKMPKVVVEKQDQN